MFKIYHLADKRVFYPVLAYWSYLHWHLRKNVSFNLILKEFRIRADCSRLPYTFIALWNEFPVGMVTLKEKDLSNRQELTPWLSALYVMPEFRNRGVGDQLIKTLINEVYLYKTDRVYLFIDSRNKEELEHYYTKRGWLYFDDAKDSDGNDTKILYYQL